MRAACSGVMHAKGRGLQAQLLPSTPQRIAAAAGCAAASASGITACIDCSPKVLASLEGIEVGKTIAAYHTQSRISGSSSTRPHLRLDAAAHAGLAASTAPAPVYDEHSQDLDAVVKTGLVIVLQRLGICGRSNGGGVIAARWWRVCSARLRRQPPQPQPRTRSHLHLHLHCFLFAEHVGGPHVWPRARQQDGVAITQRQELRAANRRDW